MVPLYPANLVNIARQRCCVCYSSHTRTYTHTLCSNGHFSRWTWVSQLPP